MPRIGKFQVFRIVLIVIALAVCADGAAAELGKDEIGQNRWREDYTRYNDGYDHLFALESYRDWAARQAGTPRVERS